MFFILERMLALVLACKKRRISDLKEAPLALLILQGSAFQLRHWGRDDRIEVSQNCFALRSSSRFWRLAFDSLRISLAKDMSFR